MPQPVHDLIRTARHRAGLSQAELARRLGISQPAIARLERAGANPRVATVERVLDATEHRLELLAPRAGRALDETQIEQHLRMTPAERLAVFQQAYANARAMLETAHRPR